MKKEYMKPEAEKISFQVEEVMSSEAESTKYPNSITFEYDNENY